MIFDYFALKKVWEKQYHNYAVQFLNVWHNATLLKSNKRFFPFLRFFLKEFYSQFHNTIRESRHILGDSRKSKCFLFRIKIFFFFAVLKNTYYFAMQYFHTYSEAGHVIQSSYGMLDCFGGVLVLEVVQNSCHLKWRTIDKKYRSALTKSWHNPTDRVGWLLRSNSVILMFESIPSIYL